MVSKSKQILEEALGLSPTERASLVDQILSSLDKPDREIDDIWRKEINERLAAYRSGRAATVSAEDVLEHYRDVCWIFFIRSHTEPVPYQKTDDGKQKTVDLCPLSSVLCLLSPDLRPPFFVDIPSKSGIMILYQ